MKFEMKKSHIAKAVALALCGSFVSAAQAAPTPISGFGTTSATIDDAGFFSPTSALGLSFNGREFVNLGTFGSNWSLNANGGSVAVADAASPSNPLGTVTYSAGSSVALTTNIGSSTSGWTVVETVSIPTSGHVAVQIQLTNNGTNATNVQWGVGIDPDQGVPVSLGFDTTNEILGQGNASAVRATSLDGWSLTLANTTSAGAFDVAAYVDPLFCCTPVDPAVMLSSIQAIGNYGFADRSINLAYDLGAIANGQSVTFGYEYIMAVPEPETYAMLLAGLGLIGFSARRRSAV